MVPSDILSTILKELDILDIITLAQTCKTFRNGITVGDVAAAYKRELDAISDFLAIEIRGNCSVNSHLTGTVDVALPKWLTEVLANIWPSVPVYVRPHPYSCRHRQATERPAIRDPGRTRINFCAFPDGPKYRDFYFNMIWPNPSLKHIGFNLNGMSACALQCASFANLTTLHTDGPCGLMGGEREGELDFPNLLELKIGECFCQPSQFISILRTPKLRILHLTFTDRKEECSFGYLEWMHLDLACEHLEEMLLGNCVMSGSCNPHYLRTAMKSLKRLALLVCRIEDPLDGWESIRRVCFMRLSHLTLWDLDTPTLQAIRAVLGPLGRQHSNISLSIDDKQHISSFEMNNVRRYVGALRICSEEDFRISQLWRSAPAT